MLCMNQSAPLASPCLTPTRPLIGDVSSTLTLYQHRQSHQPQRQCGLQRPREYGSERSDEAPLEPALCGSGGVAMIREPVDAGRLCSNARARDLNGALSPHSPVALRRWLPLFVYLRVSASFRAASPEFPFWDNSTCFVLVPEYVSLLVLRGEYALDVFPASPHRFCLQFTRLSLVLFNSSTLDILTFLFLSSAAHPLQLLVPSHVSRSSFAERTGIRPALLIRGSTETYKWVAASQARSVTTRHLAHSASGLHWRLEANCVILAKSQLLPSPKAPRILPIILATHEIRIPTPSPNPTTTLISQTTAVLISHATAQGRRSQRQSASRAWGCRRRVLKRPLPRPRTPLLRLLFSARTSTLTSHDPVPISTLFAPPRAAPHPWSLLIGATQGVRATEGEWESGVGGVVLAGEEEDIYGSYASTSAYTLGTADGVRQREHQQRLQGAEDGQEEVGEVDVDDDGEARTGTFFSIFAFSFFCRRSAPSPFFPICVFTSVPCSSFLPYRYNPLLRPNTSTSSLCSLQLQPLTHACLDTQQSVHARGETRRHERDRERERERVKEETCETCPPKMRKRWNAAKSGAGADAGTGGADAARDKGKGKEKEKARVEDEAMNVDVDGGSG
ncbi:hypothetical protein C8R44DRAFT_881135 [Mycena epipterygia]|nr:hypothetical protein C8R44DRAFT_881135 [Mycena epipterygia]